MFSFHVIFQHLLRRKLLSANTTCEASLVVCLFDFRRLTTVHFPLMSVHIFLLRESFVAEFARKPPIFIRLYPTFACFSSAGRVVTLVVRVQLFDAGVITVTDLTHNVARR